MMEQSFLFDPLIGADEKSQKRIDRAIQKKIKKNSKGAKDVNIESMLVLNSSRFQIDLETYTYYQLKAQYSTLYREQVSMMYNIARPHAKDVPMINFAEELDIHDNPFSFDKCLGLTTVKWVIKVVSGFNIIKVLLWYNLTKERKLRKWLKKCY